jgi:hypothetical protein
VKGSDGEGQETNLSSGCYGVVRVGGGVRDGVGPDVCDEGDARVVLEVLEDGGFVGEACFIASEDDAEGSGGRCDCFDDHVGGLLDMRVRWCGGSLGRLRWEVGCGLGRKVGSG